MRQLLAVVVMVGLGAAGALAQPGPDTEARRALERFIERWNTGDDARLRQAMHFPFATVAGGGVIVVADEPDDFEAGFDGLRADEGWARSAFDFDSFTVLRSSPDKVHVEVDFSRMRADDTVYRQSRVFYIVTREDGRWAIKLRAPARPPQPLDQAARDRIVSEARDAVLGFFTAFNRGDADGTVDTLHHPHLFLTASGGFGVAASEQDGPRPDFDTMRRNEGWHMSSIDALEATSVTPNKVHFQLTFTRWRPDGTRYWTVPAMWIATRADGRWGVQVRSLFPATYDAR